MCVGSLSFQHYNPTKPSTTKPYKSLNVSFNIISFYTSSIEYYLSISTNIEPFQYFLKLPSSIHERLHQNRALIFFHKIVIILRYFKSNSKSLLLI